ncbi:SRPBCC family protein [Actinoplanes aureus]|uniref:SRPBCC family protein n=1 Tax=Actinoplanes aureus TaxID=2792083 RepID=A0A931CD29_9ACTN|nr:SRPBCC family protein [Actinoplanes aureus]MBG0562675.1 SRPBCC family protein [Actinoplanes aureus]
MKITNEFTVHTSIDRAWQVLTDLEGIAPCMPGAQLTGVEGEVYRGKVKVKVGPVISDFTGTARFTSKDDAAYRAVIDAKGRDARSAGNASALVTAALTAEGPDSTKVSVDTDLKISGKLAQFGSGMIKEVSAKLLAQFVSNLEAKLAADETATSGSAAPASGSSPASSSSSSVGDGAGAAAEGAVSAAAVDTAPDTSVALGAVSPGVPDGGTSGSEPVAPDPSAGTVEPAAGRLENAEGTPDPIAPLNVPPANLIEAAESPAAAAARTSADSPAAATDVAASSGAAPVERKIESAEPEPLDLLGIAGKSIYKRAIPVVVGAAVAAAVIIWAVTRP